MTDSNPIDPTSSAYTPVELAPIELHPIETQISGLQQSVTELLDLTTTLTTAQAAQIKRTERNLRRVAYLMILVLLIGVLSTFTAYRSYQNTDRIDKIQQQTSNEVLCPIFVRSLRAYNPDSASAKQDPKGYEDSYKDIEHSATVLKCSQTKRGLTP